MIKRTKVRNVNKRKKNRRVTKKGGVLPIRIYPQADLLNAIYENNLEKVQAWGRTTTTTRDVNFNMNDQDNIYQNGYTPLTYAISRTTENSENFVDIVNLDIIKHLVSVKKANVNTRGGSVHNGTLNYTPLMFSIIRGKKDAMIYLLQMGALVDDTIDNNTTVFNFAFIKGGLEIVNTLLENTKILNMKSINDKGQLDALLKNTAHLNIIINFKEVYGKTTLMYVLENGKLENGKLEIVNKLLEKGARVDIFDNVNNTPLMYACENGNLEIVNTLLKKNSTLINHSNKFGKTALMYACEKGNLEIVNVLLQNNSYINHSNKFGNTALMYACEK
jgi:ankyrin repeat protein